MTETTIFKLWEEGVFQAVCDMTLDPNIMRTKMRCALFKVYPDLAEYDNPNHIMFDQRVRLQLLKDENVTGHFENGVFIMNCKKRSGNLARISLPKKKAFTEEGV